MQCDRQSKINRQKGGSNGNCRSGGGKDGQIKLKTLGNKF